MHLHDRQGWRRSGGDGGNGYTFVFIMGQRSGRSRKKKSESKKDFSRLTNGELQGAVVRSSDTKHMTWIQSEPFKVSWASGNAVWQTVTTTNTTVTSCRCRPCGQCTHRQRDQRAALPLQVMRCNSRTRERPCSSTTTQSTHRSVFRWATNFHY